MTNESNDEVNLLSAFGCYMSWVSMREKEYSQLVDKYNDKETNKHILQVNNAPKLVKKEKLLGLKEKGILSKSEIVELTYIEDKEKAIKVKETLIQQIESKKQRLLQEALNDYETTVKKINSSCQSSIDYSQTQYDMMISRTERIYNDKKRILDARGELLEGEREISGIVKTSPEINVEKQQSELYRKMKDIREQIELSRTQIMKSQNLTPQELAQIPNLPPLPKPNFTIQETIQVMSSLPVSEISTDEIESKKLRQEQDQLIARRKREELEKKQRDKEEFEKRKIITEHQDEQKRKERLACFNSEKTANQQALDQKAQRKTIIDSCKSESEMMDSMSKLSLIPIVEEEYCFDGKRVSKFEYDRFMNHKKQKVEKEEEDGWDSQDERDAEEAAAKAKAARETRNKIPEPAPTAPPAKPKKPMKTVKREDKSLGAGIQLYSSPE